jgi:hypothetical protein
VFLGIGAISEPYSRTPRQQSRWQHTSGWRRTLAGILAPGAASGRRCFLALLALGLAAAVAALAWPGPHRLDDVAAGAIAAACYATWFLLLGDLLFRRFVPAALHRPHWQRVLTITLSIVASVIGWLAYILLRDHWPLLAPIDVAGGMESVIAVLKSPDDSTLTAHGTSALLVLLFGFISAIVLADQSRRPVTIERLRPEDS